jgi:hypothetical protein
MTSVPAPFPFPGGRQDQGQLPGASGPRTQDRVSLPHQALQPGVNLIKKRFLSSSLKCELMRLSVCPGNTKGGSIIVPLTSCLTGLESAV